jgi:acetyl-CoA C-acetyltransferase
VKEDEGYNRLKLEKVPTLKPAFDRSGSGTVTAANSSSFNDGASALVLGSKDMAKQYGKGSKVLGRAACVGEGGDQAGGCEGLGVQRGFCGGY